jgi:LacI family transcriptional regulator
MSQRPTIKDVAKRANVSLSTVSLVINNKGYVSPKTREKVEKVINELGYHPTPSARGLALRKSGNIGFILTDDHFTQTEPFYTKIFLGAEFEAQAHNYYVLLTTIKKDFKLSNSIPRFLLEKNVDGILIAGQVSTTLLNYIDSMKIPIVLIDFDVEDHKHSTVLINNYQGTHLAVEHLINLQHRKIGFIAGDLSHPSISERYQGYKNALKQAGIPLEKSWISVNQKDTTISDGYYAAKELLKSSRSMPTALIAANDAMAIGCLQYFSEANIRVPDDIALIGFDNIEKSFSVHPSLTTVDVNKFAMGRTAIKTLVEGIAKENRQINHIRIPVTLVVRESTVNSIERVVTHVSQRQ